jgi:succinoglycan biosynthesis protein ExoO
MGWNPVLLYTDFLPGDISAMKAWWGEDFHFQEYRPRSWRWKLKRLLRRYNVGYGSIGQRLLRLLSRSGRVQSPKNDHPVPIDDYYEPELDGFIRNLDRRYQFSAVIAEYILMARSLDCFGPSCRKLVDTLELFAQGEARPAGAIKVWLNVVQADELDALRRADVVLAIQSHDANTLRAGGLQNIVTVGHALDVTDDPQMLLALASRQILFVGAGHSFDVAGLMWFWERVFPLLSDCIRPEDVVVAGGIRDVMKERPPFKFLGRVPDLGKVYRETRVVIAPLNEGTGLKIKVVEALAHGKALVTTRFGALGVDDGAGRAFLAADAPKDFANGVQLLLSDDEECSRLMRGAIDYAKNWNVNIRKQLGNALTSRDPE